ncbi:Thioredoxin reductase [Streptomyces sp. RB5]|uniref:Thioredoxin reductase n=1 Tax=Streptomyces smaragdinus TaxID=2585196 RepID=A0A7K0C989_9ACTN|nr:FAD-dependent oxidoreductase [Streptomyces smaragdinus]MQY09953.1 Thioredoxin reductase [Streptomyces smaragdinus]
MSIWANVAPPPELPDAVDAVVVGGGPAGCTAGLYLARACADTLVLAGTAPGGQLVDTGAVENYPGFPDGIDGPDLMARMREQTERAGARVLTEDAEAIRYATDGGPHEIVTARGTVRTRAVVLATGSEPRRLGLPGEQELGAGGGVAYCAVCEAPLFKGRDVAVVGGGDSAMEEVLALTGHARRVHLVHRGDRFRATPVLLERVRALTDVSVRTAHVVRELRRGPDGRLSGLTLENTATGDTAPLAVQGLFVAIGHTPRTRLAGGVLPLAPTGHLHTTGPGGTTGLPGVFVAGDVTDARYRQAVTAAAAGCAAALETTRYLEGVHA